MPSPNDYKNQLLQALASSGVQLECELCGKNNWVFAEQALSLTVTDLTDSHENPSPQIPAATVICNNCGNIRMHSLGVLGLLDSEQKGSSGNRPSS